MIKQSLIKSTAFLIGLALLCLAALSWRVSPKSLEVFHIPQNLLLTTSLTPIYLSTPSPIWPTSIPLLVIAVLLLRYSSIPTTSNFHLHACEPNSLSLWSFMALVTVSLGTCILAFVLENMKLLSSTGAPVGFLVACSVFVIALLWKDSPKQEPAFSLSTLELISLGLATVTLCVLYGYDANSWRYSFIGDEYSFFWAAQNMADPKEHIDWLEASGVYHGFPVLTSALQAASMKLFGNSNLGWKMSCVIATAVCVAPLYVLLRWITHSLCVAPRLCAALGCFLFFTLEPIQIWAKIGKPHAFFLPPIIFSLGALAWAQATSRLAWYGIAGLIAGLGCFLSPVGPSLAVGSGVVLQLFFALQAYRDGRGRFLDFLLAPGVLFFLGLVLGAAPIAVQQDYWEGLSQLNLQSEEARNARPLRAQKTLQSFFAFLCHRNQGHFMFGNPFNIVLSSCILAGLAARSSRAYLWLGASICLMFGFSLSVGGMNQYPYPPPSRIHLLAIPLCILATLGIAQLLNTTCRLARFTTVAICLAALPLTIVKITLFNPSQMLLPERAAIIRSVQASTTSPIVILLKGEDEFVKKILAGMVVDEQLIFIEQVDQMSALDMDRSLQATPINAALVAPVNLPQKDLSSIGRFASISFYETWNVVNPSPDLPYGIAAFLKFLKATEN